MLFKRTALTAPLPEPKHGGSIGDLWTWLNVSKDDRPLIAAELVARLFSDVPHVVLAILGEHGTAKTTTTKILVSLLDPSPVPVRKPPRDMESWVTMAAGSWVVALDNLSDPPVAFRLDMPRLDRRRRRPPQALHRRRLRGVRVPPLRHLQRHRRGRPRHRPGRPHAAHHPAAHPGRRPEEREGVLGRLEHRHPKLLGAILSLASKVLHRLPRLTLEKTPRMADYALVLGASTPCSTPRR